MSFLLNHKVFVHTKHTGLLHVSNMGAQHSLRAAVMSEKANHPCAVHNLFAQNYILFQKGSNETYTNTYTTARQNDTCKRRKREKGHSSTTCRVDKLS